MSIAGENTLCRARITTRDSLTCTYICINIRCIRINTYTRSWTLRDESHTSHARYTDVPSIMEKTDFKSVYIYTYILLCIVYVCCVFACAYLQMYIVTIFYVYLYTYNTHTYSTKSTIIACTILGWRATWRIKTIITFIDHACRMGSATQGKIVWVWMCVCYWNCIRFVHPGYGV